MPETPSVAAESTSREAPAYRLVIRAQIVSEPIPDVPAEPSLNKRALALIAAAIVVLVGLGWIGFNTFRTDSASRPTVSNTPQPVAEPTPLPAPTTQSTPSETVSPLRAVDQVTPTPSASALATVRGTIRVAIRVTIDQHGRVIDTATAEPGPSKYFQRLSREASKKWTFTPTSNETSRSALLRFQFTRSGATARVIAAQ